MIQCVEFTCGDRSSLRGVLGTRVPKEITQCMLVVTVSQQYLPLSQSVFDLLLVAFQVVVERASKVMISCQAQQQETGASVIGLGRQEESTWL